MTQRLKRNPAWPKLPQIRDGRDPSHNEQQRILKEIREMKESARSVSMKGPTGVHHGRGNTYSAPGIRVCHDPRPYSRR